MNDQEKDHINKNLPRLIELTICSEHLLAILSAQDILGSNDVAVLENKILNSHEKSKKLYDILKTRKNGYKIIKDALLQTRQTGAHEILHKIIRVNGVAGKSLKNQITYDRNIKIGTGASSTKVFRGKFGIRDVAVKQISLDDIDVTQALKEINLLKTVDWHENIVQYYTAEVIDSYILIALELCSFNLDEWVESNRKENFDPVEVLRQATSGIAHLHKNNIIHGDLKPANILISVLQQDGFRVKISDFGMSKKVLDDKTSCTLGSSGLVIGTNGWIAPEVAKYLEGNPSAKTVLKMSFAADIFSLGCVYYFVLTNGSHPFGHKFRRLTNILDDKFSLKISELTCKENGVISLIRDMIKYNHKERPPSSALLSHLFFWSSDKKLSFLSDVSTGFKTNSGDVRQCISRIDSSYFMSWPKNISPEVREFLGKLDSTSSNIKELINAIVGRKNDFESIPQSVKKVLGELPDKFIEYWDKRFYLLLPVLLQSLQSLKDGHSLKPYFVDNYNFNFILDSNNQKSAKFPNSEQSFSSNNILSNSSPSTKTHTMAKPQKNFEDNVYKTLSVKTLAKEFEILFKDKTPGLDPNDVREERKLMETIKLGSFAAIKTCCQNFNNISLQKHVRNIKRVIYYDTRSPKLQPFDLEFGSRLFSFGTLLHNAVMRGNFEIVEFLLEKQGFQEILKIESLNQKFRRLFFVCVVNTKGVEDFVIEEKVKILSTLVKIRPNLLEQPHYESGSSPLFGPFVHVDLLIHLIKLGSDTFIRDYSRNTFLHQVAEYISPNDYYKLINSIINQKLVDILYKCNEKGLSSLVVAMKTFEITLETFQLLHATSDFNINKHDSNELNKKSLLCCAVEQGRSSKFIDTLVNMGANTKNVDKDGSSLIHVCVKTGNLDLLAYVLSKYKTIINDTDNEGRTALHYMFLLFCKNQLKLTEMLVSKGIDVNIKLPKCGNKAIFFALKGTVYIPDLDWNDRVSILKCLTKKDKDINSYNSRGYTLLHEAVFYHIDNYVIHHLITLGVNEKALTNFSKQTMLHIAVKAKNDKAIEYLIQAGVDVNARDINGLTAVHLLFSKNIDDRTDIMCLGQTRNYKTFHILNLFGDTKTFNWKAKTNQGETILDLADDYKYLLDRNIIPYIKRKVF